jgi:serine/threonine-protein kinase RsbW
VSAEPDAVKQASNSALVRTVTGPLVGPVVSRVVGMLAARANCPVDRLDNALLVVDAVAAHAAAYTPDGRLTVRATTTGDALELRVGPLRKDGADALLRDCVLPSVGNVVERAADEVVVETDAQSGGQFLTVRIGF